MAKKNYFEDNFIKDLITKRENKLKVFVKKVKAWLEEKGYYDYDKDKQKEYIGSLNGLALIEGMAENELTTVEIAKVLSITQKQLQQYMRENPAIYDSIDSGRSKKIDMVEKMLFEMSTDRKITERKTIELFNDRNPDIKSYRVEEFERTIPANFAAAQYIMNIHRPLEYRAKKIEDVEDDKEKVVFVIQFPDLSKETINKEDNDE